MAASSCYRYSIFLQLLAVIFLFSHLSLCDQTQDMIDKICRQMEEYGFCDKTFHENLVSPSTDIAGLADIAITQSLKNATSTHDFIAELLQNVTDVAVKNALIACENGYKIVQESFQEASTEFNQKDYDSVCKSIQGTPRAQGSCDTSFATPPNPANPLVERNREMRILIAMSVVSALELNR